MVKLLVKCGALFVINFTGSQIRATYCWLTYGLSLFLIWGALQFWEQDLGTCYDGVGLKEVIGCN